ncbi:interleukin-23 receptor isoform X3 [Corvus moneduloides]|uniref:interleukin-23 receptor isoform X3 n=1 Tax=Corvus moneduloides TaxID=1196302 RepID=UPI0013633E70|nr:interleukin-23 receptor isoform X3 [Corvus moneduloides]
MAGSGEALVLHVLLCCLCQGVATIECRGHVWIEPAPVVRMGSDISITCRSALDCPSAQLLILLNYSRTEETPLVLDGSTVRLRLRDFRMPFATVACFSLCASNHRHRLVCGAEVRAGYPPDPPGNLSCAIAEGSECLQCAWDAGRDTHLPTRHSLHLRRLADDEDEEEEKTFPADSPVLLRELHNASHYSVWVQASNALGTARSAPRHLSLQELVVPALPVVIGAETTETSPPSTTTRWRSRTQLQNVHCEERHRATGTPTWHVELGHSVAQEGPRWQHELQSDTQFVFQVRCRLSTAHSPWSAWSPPFLYSTPEAAPAAAPGVWRRLGPALPNGSREVTVLIKPLPARDARGRILGYAVSAEGAEGTGTLCRTSGTECAVLVPPGARALLVTAHNSKGASSPASIPLNRGAGQEEFPAPEAVEVKPENQSRVLVQWQPPQHSQRPLLWFILEWVSSSQQHQEEQYFWEKVPHQETHTYIQAEAAAGAPLSVSLYAVYPDGISNPSSGRVPPEEPLLGSTYSEMSQDDDIGALLGLSLGVVGLAVLFAIVMFKKSVRKRTRVISPVPVSTSHSWPPAIPHLRKSRRCQHRRSTGARTRGASPGQRWPRTGSSQGAWWPPAARARSSSVPTDRSSPMGMSWDTSLLGFTRSSRPRPARNRSWESSAGTTPALSPSCGTSREGCPRCVRWTRSTSSSTAARHSQCGRDTDPSWRIRGSRGRPAMSRSRCWSLRSCCPA